MHNSTGLKANPNFEHSSFWHAFIAQKIFKKPHTTSEALENRHQVGVFTQVNSAEQRLQKRQTEGLFQVGEDVVHHSGYGDLIPTGFQGFLKKWNRGLLYMIIK